MVILIVEDEAIIAYCSTSELEDAGHAVLGPARSSAEALALARQRRPDVALVDIDLEVPGAGIALARRLRAEHGVVVIFTTGQPELARAHADCALGVIAKPYDPTELSEIVEYAGAAGGGRSSPPVRPRSLERFDRRAKPLHREWLSEMRSWEPATAGRHDS